MIRLIASSTVRRTCSPTSWLTVVRFDVGHPGQRTVVVAGHRQVIRDRPRGARPRATQPSRRRRRRPQRSAWWHPCCDTSNSPRDGPSRVFWRELTIVGARVYQRDDFVAAIDLLSSGAIPADPLITDITPLRHTRRALTELGRSNENPHRGRKRWLNSGPQRLVAMTTRGYESSKGHALRNPVSDLPVRKLREQSRARPSTPQ